ncbi:MAG: ATP-binding protein [Desulfosarcinaceae bacterium]
MAHSAIKNSSDNQLGLDVLIEAPYYNALNQAPIPVLITREDGRMLLVNEAFQSATGLGVDDIPTIEAWSGHILNAPEKSGEPLSRRLFELERALEPLRISLRSANGKTLHWDLFNAPLGRTSNGLKMAITIVSDVTVKVNQERHLKVAMTHLEAEVERRTKDLNTTIHALENEIAERKRMAEALAHSQKRLKQISMRTLNVLEADRQTVSKELHDGVGASLAAIKFSLEEKEFRRVQSNGRLDASLQQEITYLLSTIKETKRISANLRPTTLDDLGLVATIEWYLRQYQRMYGNIDVHYDMDLTEAEVPEKMKIIIYRIVQEGLSNAEKHSEASTVHLKIRFCDDKHAISVSLQDDGRGFDVDETLSEKDPLSGYGLTAMRERCEIFGGSFHIDSKPGAGTTIDAILPI